MKSNSQTKVSHNNRKFDGLIVKEKNKNDYTKIDKQICFAIFPKNNYIQIKKMMKLKNYQKRVGHKKKKDLNIMKNYLKNMMKI